MAKVKYIVFLAICLASCKTASQFPMDDAYYRPEKSTPIIQSTQNTPSTPKTPTTPTMEVLHQQDTTITVRIKR